MYELLVVVHILSAMAWVGGGFLFLLGLRSVRKAEGPDAAGQTMARLEKASAIINPAPFLVIGTGVVMVLVSDAWSFSQTWVYLAVTLFVLALVLGAGFADRLDKQMRQARERGEPIAGQLDRFIRFGFTELALLAGIVFLMVYKPV